MAPRIAGIFALYAAVFVVLVVIQFSNRRILTRRVGAMTLTLHFKTGEGSEFPEGPGNYPFGALGGDVFISLGGMDFRLRAADGFSLLGEGGLKIAAVPELLVLDEGAAVLYFPSPAGEAERTRLIFAASAGPAGPGLRISGVFSGSCTGAEIPYRVQRSARVRNGEDGGFIVTSGGLNFSFGRTGLDTERRVVLPGREGAVSYRALGDGRSFSPANYSLVGARDREEWAAYLNRWREQLFAAWSQTPTASLNDEELITAYIAEAAHRGRYREVVSRVSRSFLDGPRRTYVSSAFLGGMTQALRSFTAAERERSARLAALPQEDPVSFLVESRALAGDYRRTELFAGALDALSALASGGAPAEFPGEELFLARPELAPAALEFRADWQENASVRRDPDENPFDRLALAALDFVALHLRMDGNGQWVLLFTGNQADTDLNFRLGQALDRYGSGAGREDWAALGRSLMLSVLNLTDAAGTLPRTLGAPGTLAEGPRISAARFYSRLAPENYPRLESLPGPGSAILVWTATETSAAWDGDALDIAVRFPPGDTHYLIIRGLRPFTLIQIYGVDYRSDAQFERYDSAGWVYDRAEQALLVKMRHRSPEEHIRVIYTPPRPAPQPPASAEAVPPPQEAG
ncbi:MAG: hypothetical protein LBQ35_04425 [Spirochaetaceae bacterium]|nr:hypothetical protein [Spirochaetaceae bacterium]